MGPCSRAAFLPEIVSDHLRLVPSDDRRPRKLSAVCFREDLSLSPLSTARRDTSPTLLLSLRAQSGGPEPSPASLHALRIRCSRQGDSAPDRPSCTNVRPCEGE